MACHQANSSPEGTSFLYCTCGCEMWQTIKQDSLCRRRLVRSFISTYYGSKLQRALYPSLTRKSTTKTLLLFSGIFHSWNLQRIWIRFCAI